MTIKQFFIGFAFILWTGVHAQADKKVLFTIDEKPYYTDEFIRVYNKNLDLVKDESQKDLDQYLALFVGYKLKVSKANALGLQDNPQYLNELKSYRTQLAKNYLSDSEVTNELIEEGYNRSLKEVRASHILLTLDENAKPEDTLAAYKNIIELRDRVNQGEDFGQLAAKFSNDPSAKENKGDLGYFSAFRMVYPFETAAFTTPKGQISQPIRTRFGYHIIQVNDIRDNRGEVTVAHIMLMNPTDDSPTDMDKNKTTIFEIYSKIQQGESFEALAKQFSQDKSSASKGGILNRFGSGQLSSEEFETTAFSLQSPDEISKPFQTQFGWHIMKLVEKHPLKSLDEARADMETKISRDERSRKITESLNEKLRVKFPVKRNEAVYAKIKKAVDNSFYDSAWKVPESMNDFSSTFISFANQEVKGEKFLNFLSTQQKTPSQLKPIGKLVDFYYQSFVDSELNQFYNDDLENQFPEFAAVMDEYRDGLLLFDLMEKEIWEKSKTDTLGLESFYTQNLNKYQWKKRYDVLLLSSTKEDIAKKAHKLMKKGKSVDEIKKELNTSDVVNIMTTAGVFEEDNTILPKKVNYQKGLQSVVHEDDYYYVVQVNNVQEAGPKTLAECKGKAVNDYQQYLEQNWVGNLKQEFKVQINQDVFSGVKKQLGK